MVDARGLRSRPPKTSQSSRDPERCVDRERARRARCMRRDPSEDSGGSFAERAVREDRNTREDSRRGENPASQRCPCRHRRRSDHGERARFRTDARRGDPIERPTTPRSHDRERGVREPPRDLVRNDGQNGSAHAASEATHSNRALTLTGCVAAEDGALACAVADDAERAAFGTTGGRAARTTSRPSGIRRGRPRSPGLDVDPEMDDSFAAPRFS